MASVGESASHILPALDRPSTGSDSAREGSPARTSNRYVLLDGVRGLAALAVVIHHFTSMSGHRELFASAPLAVDFFFCLSGFVIAHAYLPRLAAGLVLASFTAKRIVRLYPMYAIGTLLGLAGLLMLHRDGQTDLSPEAIATSFALNLFYVPYLNGAHMHLLANDLTGALFPQNTPAWSLFFELVANGLFAVTIVRWPRSPLAWIGASAIGICLSTWIYGQTPGWGTANILGGLPRVLFPFFAGVAIYQFPAVVARLPRLSPVVVALAVTAMLLMPQFHGHSVYFVVCALVVVPLLVALGSRSLVAPDTFAHHLCDYSGRISYPLYCIHYPLLMMVAATSLRDIAYPILLPGFLLASIGASHLALTGLDEPVRAWLGRRGRPS